ncbi:MULTISPECIES: LysR family transcriptional regulator [unclassified Microbacterium]|uniref:LysR family transcriptional regulator n=1 Tax=unclassified Microbacterium TaxID=2609290 RepID=UPI00214B0DC7|nr:MULTISPECIES: LysR family transcriptional regulator [unclassified Microbacterium]MCR2785645.1 LysR family transcriptional regulator [Microbacterium sp. zg.B96]WIM17370.1 LysR family transcriptional regulator [Microbacterium sp. zg-B96]
MELRQLRSFLAVADELHFGRAAAELNMSQPPLSAQIRRLEQDLRVQLFQRTTRQVKLTPAGAHLRDRARSLLADIDVIVDETREIHEGVRGSIRVGFISSASYTAIPRAVSLFRSRFPNVRLALDPLTSGEQVEALRAGRLDIGLIRGDGGDTRGLHTLELFAESLVALVPAFFPLAEHDVVTPEQLVDEPMILFPRRLMPGFVAQVLSIFTPTGRTPRVIQQAIHQETVVNLVAAGVGVSILPESVSRFCPEEVRVLPISSSPTTSLLAAMADSAPLGVVRSFLTCLTESTHLD